VSYEQSLQILENLDKKFSKSEMNESDTRFQIIDKIIKNIFYWPDSGIKTETHTNEGYTDYQLTDKDKPYLVIEAKKEKIKFNFSEYSEVRNRKIKVKVLMKDDNTKKTILQVKNYCQDIGCRYACITNGHEWAFFRAYIDGTSWQDGNAYIISSLTDYTNNFNEINKYFTYNKITKNYSFKKLFDGIEYSSNERYEPKRQINGYDEQIENNYIAHYLKGYFEKYFGAINPNDKELLRDCYVTERGYSINFENMTSILEDVLSPYMNQEKNIQALTDKNSLSEHLITIIKEEKKSKVLVLFGGKGAGKTTFLVSLFNSDKNKKIKENSVIAQINLLKVANDQESIKNEILSQLMKKLDIDNLLFGSNIELQELFKDKFDIELKQSLEGLSHTSETFILKRNELLKQYKEDKMYCLIRLANYLRNKNKALIINIDNTDQFDQNLQDYCFSLANEFSEKLHCLSIISLREERYNSSSIEGYLDAYEKNGFHISSPNPRQVFLKRLIFIAKKINSENKIPRQYKKDISILFDILKDNLNNENSEFNKFMMAATHGNIRQGLELFENFIFSNYTNVAEMINQQEWHITLHQILKPIMIPIYRFYDEETSTSIPNIYRLRSEFNSSHLTAYRILNKLAIRKNYVSIHELKSYFIDNFNMEDDFLLNIDLLLKRGMIESENGLDKLSDDLQKLKISSFGYYMQETIFKDFTYLELVSSDLAVLDKQVSNQITQYSNQDFKLLKDAQLSNVSKEEENKNRYERIKTRISKVRKFYLYLQEQEKLEQTKYEFTNNMVSQKIKDSIEGQIKKSIEPSAMKNLNQTIKVKSTEDKNGIKKLD
jgi:hypothetical protein